MPQAIFLSASVPDPRRCPESAETADAVAIAAAVSALVYVTLGRRHIVWGGHPAITPMIWAVAEDFSVDYDKWVRLYQSRIFEDEYPEDNERFQNVVYTDAVGANQAKSLSLMRERMLSDHSYSAAVFIGGMQGILDEFAMFQRLQPHAAILPILSTGGATRAVGARLSGLPDDLRDDLDYIGLFHRHLAISTGERRYRRPEDQPADIDARQWKPPMPRT